MSFRADGKEMRCGLQRQRYDFGARGRAPDFIPQLCGEGFVVFGFGSQEDMMGFTLVHLQASVFGGLLPNGIVFLSNLPVQAVASSETPEP